MRKRIAVILLAAMMTGCGSVPPGGTEIPDAATEAAYSTNAPQTAGEKVDKEKAEIAIGPETAQVTKEPTAVPESEAQVTKEPTAVPESEAQVTKEPTAVPESEVQAAEEPTAVPATEVTQTTEDAPKELTAPGHTCRWDGGSVTRPATCGSEGILTYVCTVCGKTRADSIAKTAHGSTVTVLAFGQQEPDCFWGAKYDVKCETCGEYVDTIYKEALGHAGDEGVVTCKPDCTGGGSIKYTCTRCGLEWSEMYGQVQPHTWVEGFRKETDWLNGGVKEVSYLYCSICGKRQESVNAEEKEENE